MSKSRKIPDAKSLSANAESSKTVETSDDIGGIAPCDDLAAGAKELREAAAEIEAKASISLRRLRGQWAPVVAKEYLAQINDAILSCSLSGQEAVGAGAAARELGKAYFSELVAGGDKKRPGEASFGLRECLAKYGQLPSGPARQGAAWATQAHFAAMEKALAAHKEDLLGEHDFFRWQSHIEGCFVAGLEAARGASAISLDFSTNIWSPTCMSYLRWQRECHLEEGKHWTCGPHGLDGLELAAYLSIRSCWQDIGGASPNAEMVGLMARSQELLFVRHWEGERTKKGATLGKDGFALEAELSKGSKFCSIIGAAAAATPEGREEMLRLASRLRDSFANLAKGSSEAWAGAENSGHAVHASPWVVRIVAEAAKASQELMTARNGSGETIGGLLNGALASASHFHLGVGSAGSQERLSRRWMEEGVLDLLEASPDGGAMIVPVVSAREIAASDAIRAKAEQVEIQRSLASRAEGAGPPREKTPRL